MKWFLIGVLIVIVMLIANSLSEQYRDKFNFYENLKQFLIQFKLNLNFKQDKINDFLNKTESKKQFKLFINAYKEYLKTNRLNLSEIKILDYDEQIQLENIIKNIGCMDVKNEINQIENFLIEIEKKMEKTELEKNKFCPMIIKLSLLFALAVAIILI